MYVRKTYDVWRVYAYYCPEYGYEEVYEAQSRAEAVSVMNDYRREDGVPVKIKKCRLKKEEM